MIHIADLPDHSISNLQIDALQYQIRTDISNLQAMYSEIQKSKQTKHQLILSRQCTNKVSESLTNLINSYTQLYTKHNERVQNKSTLQKSHHQITLQYTNSNFLSIKY